MLLSLTQLKHSERNHDTGSVHAVKIRSRVDSGRLNPHSAFSPVGPGFTFFLRARNHRRGCKLLPKSAKPLDFGANWLSYTYSFILVADGQAALTSTDSVSNGRGRSS